MPQIDDCEMEKDINNSVQPDAECPQQASIQKPVYVRHQTVGHQAQVAAPSRTAATTSGSNIPNGNSAPHEQLVSINRQQLGARVRTITGKLLDSHGPELRRTLFSLRQIFQADQELAYGFVEFDGLDCLLRVAKEADQIHQNYILRALGQLIGTPSGLAALARHSETIQWLYSLLESQHRLVVRTSLKLLSTFVEDNQQHNCVKFFDAIKIVDKSNESSLCSNLTRLFVETQPTKATGNTASRKQNSPQTNTTKNPNQLLIDRHDTDLLLDAIKLINTTIAGLARATSASSNQLYLYNEFVKQLLRGGMDRSIAEKYSSLDAQLREQFKLYEKKIRSTEEDIDESAREVTSVKKQEHKFVNSSNMSSNSNSSAQRCELVSKPDSIRVKCVSVKDEDDANHHLTANQLANRPYRRTAMNVTIRRPTVISAHQINKDQKVESNKIENQSLAKSELNDSGETTNDDNYESANDDDDEGDEDDDARPQASSLTTTIKSIYSPTALRKSVTLDVKSSDNASSSSPASGSGGRSHDNNNSFNDKERHSNTSTSPAKNKRLVQIVNANHQHQVIKRQHQIQTRCQRSTSNTRPTAETSQIELRTSNMTPEAMETAPDMASSKQKNLTRGKQQRASISSCSSSDSYASYGSGYASGSGNSTDHEHKQQLLRRQQQAQSPKQESFSKSKLSSSANGTGIGKSHGEQEQNSNHLTTVTKSLNTRTQPAPKREDVVVASCDDDDDDDGDEEVDDGREGKEHVDREADGKRLNSSGRGESGFNVKEKDESDSQLNRHLSELEQLTDELAKRDILSSHSEADDDIDHQHNHHGARVNDEHYSSTIKSNSSQTSSVLSTSSNVSSITSNIGAERQEEEDGYNQQQRYKLAQRQGQVKTQVSASTTPSSTSLLQNPLSLNQISFQDESRSTSTTPTTINADSNEIAQQQSIHKPNYTQQTKQVLSSSNATNQQHRSSVRPFSQQYTKSASIDSPSATTSTKQQQDPYYHNLFQWEQLVSKGVTRPLLINDLDFTDLRDEDDCDLLNTSTNNGNASRGSGGRNHFSGEPLTISIPVVQNGAHTSSTDHDSVDSGASTSSPGREQSLQENASTPASAPPPMPPPPISPWFNTISGSRPQSQFMSSPSPPPFELNSGSTSNGDRDQSPAYSTYSNYSRNSVCVGPNNLPLSQQYNSLQLKGNLRAASSMSSLLFGNNNKFGNKRKKTMKLFWKEVREDKSLLAKLTKKKTIWDEIKPVLVDTQKLEYLFESKAKDLLLSKSRNGLDGTNQRKVKITVLDAKRSNAINIGMTKLPPMRTIKSAILKMDSSIMNREGIEKILTTMMPTEEEKSRIIEAQLANPDTPLGTAEQFLLNLASISALEARLKLWAFQLDYAQIEKEVSEPLMDLKQAIEEIERSDTFRVILGTLLSIGNFLNSTNAKGFQIDYLEKVPEVKDTVHKHSLLHHLCLFIIEKHPELESDLYSEFGAVNRASKVDYAELAKSLKKMQQDCKASWDHLKIVAKHDGLANLMNTCGMSSSSPSSCDNSPSNQHQPKSSGKLNNLSKLSMITTVIGSDNNSSDRIQDPGTKQLKIKVSDFLTDCAERIMVLMVIHRRVMNRFQKLLVYLGCPSHQIKQTQPQQILKIINEFALEYRTKRSRVRDMLMRAQKCQHHHHNLHGPGSRARRWQMSRWDGSNQCIDSMSLLNNRASSTTSSCASPYAADNISMASCSGCAFGPSGNCGNDSTSHQTLNHHANMSQRSDGGGNTNGNRYHSPSGISQISNYSDYIFDHSCCGSRRESMTPAPSEKFLNSAGANRRAHSMSVSMFDLQQQSQRQNSNRDMSNQASMNGNDELTDSLNESLDKIDENELTTKQKDEQLRRLLGVDKSFYGACKDLYQMKHWSSTMAGRVTRPERDGKLAAIRRMSGQQLERRESDEHGHHTLPA